MGGFIAGLRVCVYHSLYFYGFLVVIKPEVILIIGGQARWIAEGTSEEGDKAQAGEDCQLPVLAGDKEDGERDECGKEKGRV